MYNFRMDKTLQRAIAFGIIAAVFIAGYYLLYQKPKADQRKQSLETLQSTYQAQTQANKEKNLQDCVAYWDNKYREGVLSVNITSTETLDWFGKQVQAKKDDCYKLYK